MHFWGAEDSCSYFSHTPSYDICHVPLMLITSPCKTASVCPVRCLSCQGGKRCRNPLIFIAKQSPRCIHDPIGSIIGKLLAR